MSPMTSRWRIGALVLAVAMAGACSSGGNDDKVNASDSKDKTTTTLSLASDETTTTGVSGTTGSTVKGATATTLKGAPATTGAAGGSSATTAAQGEAAPVAAANGTYTYSQSGNTPDGPVPATGTLVVNNPSYSRYYDQSKAPQRLTYTFRGDGAFITAATLSFNGASANCTLGNGLAAPPWPATPGISRSASGSCSTPIGPLTVVASSRVNSRSGDIVNLSITVHAYNANKSLDVTLNDTEGWSISKRIPRTSHQVFSGTALGNPVNGDVTSTLQG